VRYDQKRIHLTSAGVIITMPRTRYLYLDRVKSVALRLLVHFNAKKSVFINFGQFKSYVRL